MFSVRGLGDRCAEESCPAGTQPCLSDGALGDSTRGRSPPRVHLRRDTAHCRRHRQLPSVCDKRQGSFIWKILPYQQLQKFESTLVLPRKSMWGQHDGKRKVGQENHLGGLLTPPLGGKRLRYTPPGSGILGSPPLNWV